jgi:hypothetical protein
LAAEWQRRAAWCSLPALAFVLPVVASSLVALQPTHGGNNAMIELSNGDSGRSLKVSVGTEINVTLKTIGSGRYGTASVSSRAVQFLDEAAGPPIPGGPVQLMRFRAQSAGAAQISIPFNGGMGPNAATPPFTLSVQVTGATAP